MLGKRARAHMRRTTSMTGIAVDPAGKDNMGAPPASDLHNPFGTVHVEGPADEGHVTMVGPPPPTLIDHQRLTAVLSPRYYRRDLSDHGGLGTANFLRTCGLCDRRLAPGRDIYMYRGDAAFCSQECREQMMKQDERKEKHKMAVSKKVEAGHHNQYSELNTTASDSSNNSETIAAA